MNRHLYGDMLPARANIPDCVTVSAGDLMLIADHKRARLNVGLFALSGGTNFCYPWASGNTATGGTQLASVTCPFLGVALDDSPKGSTDTISVATSGVFEFLLSSPTGVTMGEPIQANRPSGFNRSSTTTASYQVVQNTASGGVTIGFCQKSEVGAKTVRVLLRTKFGYGGIIEHDNL